MGIDISMNAGVGIHITSDQIDAWLKRVDPDGNYGPWEMLENLVYSDTYRGLTFASPNNSWVDAGEPNGFVILVNRVTEDFDMGRSAEAGVFRPNKNAITLEERRLLNAIAVEITGSELTIEPIISVGVH